MTLLTIEEAAERLKVSKRTIRRYISAGRLPAIRVTRKTVRIDDADIAQLLRGDECKQ